MAAAEAAMKALMAEEEAAAQKRAQKEKKKAAQKAKKQAAQAEARGTASTPLETPAPSNPSDPSSKVTSLEGEGNNTGTPPVDPAGAGVDPFSSNGSAALAGGRMGGFEGSAGGNNVIDASQSDMGTWIEVGSGFSGQNGVGGSGQDYFSGEPAADSPGRPWRVVGSGGLPDPKVGSGGLSDPWLAEGVGAGGVRDPGVEEQGAVEVAGMPQGGEGSGEGSSRGSEAGESDPADSLAAQLTCPLTKVKWP